MELKYDANACFTMNIQASSRAKSISMLCGVFGIVAMAAIAPYVAAYGVNYAYAQSANPCVNNPNPCTYGIKYTGSDNPYGPMQGIAVGVGIGIAGLLAGVGVFTTVKRTH